MRHAVWIALLGVVLAWGPRCAVAQSGDGEALDAAVKAMCHVQVAMLGESSTHGDGHTVAFKVALVGRLVNECGFDAVDFEASHYEFLRIAEEIRAGHRVSAEEVSTAVGGIWKFDQEFQPLIPFLVEKANARKISLGGIDDQLGQMGQDYANVAMVSMLTEALPEPRRQECRVALHARIYSEQPTTEASYAALSACLTAMRESVHGDGTADAAERAERLEMIANAERWIDRDQAAGPQWIVARDRSMYRNFAWLQQQRPLRHKVIVWAATVHVAKAADPTWGDHSGENFGSYVHRDYGKRAFALGFSALGGSYRKGSREVHPMPVAPEGSVEVYAMRGSTAEAVFVGRARLAAMGEAEGAFFSHAYERLAWAKFLDGVVVFREERPPVSSR